MKEEHTANCLKKKPKCSNFPQRLLMTVSGEKTYSLGSPNRLCLIRLVMASGKSSSKDLHSSCQGRLLRLALLPPCPTSRFPMDLQEV